MVSLVDELAPPDSQRTRPREAQEPDEPLDVPAARRAYPRAVPAGALAEVDDAGRERVVAVAQVRETQRVDHVSAGRPARRDRRVSRKQ